MVSHYKKQNKTRSRPYPAETDADSTEDLTLVTNIPGQYLLYSLKQAVRDIGLYVNW